MSVEMCRPSSPAVVEAALRWLATRREGGPLRFLRYAMEDPSSESAAVLGGLLESSVSLPAATPETRALAVWGLIADEVRKVGSAGESRRRNTLIAAFRLPPGPGVEGPWRATLDDRFKQLKGCRAFANPSPSTTTPMHKAWKRALGEKLVPCLLRHFELFRSRGDAWRPYVEIGRTADGSSSLVRAPGFRAPSKGAQPVFLERMVVTVEMHRRTIYRRITERKVTACEDGVDGYVARALIGWTNRLDVVPVKALWGCRVEALSGEHRGDPVLARLRFLKPLAQGQRLTFSSEAIEERLEEEHYWVNVDVDHHGIAPGALDVDGDPAVGLTIRVNFDDQPESCWWYAEQTDHERRRRPPAGDHHLLTVEKGFVQHTFRELCQPRENYGVAFRWPPP